MDQIECKSCGISPWKVQKEQLTQVYKPFQFFPEQTYRQKSNLRRTYKTLHQYPSENLTTNRTKPTQPISIHPIIKSVREEKKTRVVPKKSRQEKTETPQKENIKALNRILNKEGLFPKQFNFVVNSSPKHEKKDMHVILIQKYHQLRKEKMGERKNRFATRILRF